MILVIIGISLAITAAGIWKGIYNEWCDMLEYLLTVIGVICLVFAIIFSLFCIGAIATATVLDEKIEMYQAENEKIENQISEMVQRYQTHESETYKEFAPDEAVTLVSLYPELKSDELVSRQISIYTENSEKIKELKEEKITASVYRWWLYFGK